MLDLGFVRANLALVKENLARRGSYAAALLDGFEEQDRKRRAAITQLEGLKAERNQVSAEIAECKRNGEDVMELMARTRFLKGEIDRCEQEEMAAGVQMSLAILQEMPNVPDQSVPDGSSAGDNVEVRHSRIQPHAFNFQPKPHWELGEQLEILDFERAAKISGARFAVYWGDGARMERALANFMLDMHRVHGYREVLPPYMVNRSSLFGTGQLPKFANDLFRCADPDIEAQEELEREEEKHNREDEWGDLRATFNDHWLIPTAEVPLTNLYRDEILDEKQLPISLTAYTPCFRAEAGSHGKDVRGLIRQHQFQKVELVKFVAPEQSYAEHEKLTADAEAVLQALELPYRVMNLCAGDLGFSAAKTYDLEVWLPGQGVYREISSCSNCEAFQARRAKIRYRPQGQKKPEFIHTLNGSGLAVGRTWLAIVENYQQGDGSIQIPKALQPYMGGQMVIRPAER